MLQQQLLTLTDLEFYEWICEKCLCQFIDLGKSDCGLLFIDEHLSKPLNHILLQSEESAVWYFKTEHKDDYLSVQVQASCQSNVTTYLLSITDF